MPRPQRDIPWTGTREGTWYVFWYDQARRRTQRLSLRTTDPATAARRFAAFLVEGAAEYAGAASPRGEDVTADVLLDAYMREHVAKKVIDTERIDYAIRNLKPHFGTLRVQDIDVPVCEGYRVARETGAIGRPSSGPTIRRELGVLSAAMNHAVKWKRVRKEDVPVLELPAKGEARDRVLKHTELAALLAAATPRCAAFIRLAYRTGARPSAIRELTWFQVDLEQRRIRLNPAGRQQTKKRRPIVPIDDETLALLKKLKAEATSEYVLGDPGSLRKAFAGAVRRAGLAGTGVVPYTLRHTRATHLLQSGVDPWAVANLLGDNLQTVIDNYGHACPDHMKEVLG